MNILKKRPIIIFILSLTLLVMTSLFYIFLNSKDILLKTDLNCNFREEVYLKDFIYKLDGTLKNNYKVDTRTVGKQTIKAIYQDHHGFYRAKKFNIEVHDITSPTILVNTEYTVTKGHNKKLEDEILCADDYDDNTKCTITGSYNLDEVGIYPLTIKATDKSGNITTKDFNLNVIDEKNTKDNSTTKPEKEQYTAYDEVYKKYKNNNTMIGIDVSKWQKDIDFEKLQQQKVEFIFIKIAGQRKINGDITLDPKFKKNIEEANKRNIKVGLYFYSYAKTPKEAKKQAKYIIKNIKKYKVELPIAFDWENWTEYNSFKLSFNSLNNIAAAFIEEIEKNGYKSLLYTSEYYLDTIWFNTDYDNIWIAKYGELEKKDNHQVWQLCSDGKIDGIDAYIDIDVMYLK